MHCKYLTKDQGNYALKIYIEEYIQYYRQVEKFEAEVLETKEAAEEEPVVVTVPAATAAVPAAVAGRGVRSEHDHCSTMGDNLWSDEKLDGITEPEPEP